jgi:hypothetical protein
MSNPVKVYSPAGEMFEVTRLNAHDLVTHAGWSYNNVAAATPAPPPAPVQPVAPTPAAAPATPEEPVDGVQAEAEAEAPAALTDEAFDEEAAAARYAALDKPAMLALLQEEFSFDADGRTSLPKLVAKAVELEKAAFAA